MTFSIIYNNRLQQFSNLKFINLHYYNMTDFTQPDEFFYLYKNDKSPGQSLDEKVGLAECYGHILRDSKTGKFLYFPDITILSDYFKKQEKPFLHSVINKFRPVRFNLELDIPVELLNNIVFSKAITDKIEQDGLDLDLIKSMKALEHVQECIYDILEEYGIEMADYKFLTASDNRKEKYSYRMYLKLSFLNMIEYKHFITQLKERVRPEILPMIDPTSLMLRTPGSYKDNHMAKWTTPCCIEDSILSYTDNCDPIEPQAPEQKEETFEVPSGDLTNKAVALLATHPLIQGNYYYTGEDKGLLNLKRIQPCLCTICDRVHDNIDAYAVIYRGNLYLKCFRDDTKKSIFLGFIGDVEPMKFRWADIKNMMKAQDKLKETGMSNKERADMSVEQQKLLDDVKKEADAYEKELRKIEKYYYTDTPKFHKKTFNDKKEVLRWVEQAVAKIMMGGNSLFITSDFWKNTKHFTEMSMLPCSRKTESYSITLINPDVDVNQPFDSGKHAKNPLLLNATLEDIINDYTMMNFYKCVDFVPYLIPPSTIDREIFNMFEGFRFSYTKTTEIKPSVKKWVNHTLNIVCSGNEEQAKTLTQWMAHIVQKPTEKSFAIIIYGAQGAGKSLLYEFFKRCIGKDLGLQVSKLEDITQSHNTHLRGKLIINANEATNEPCVRDVNILKGLITETDLTINPKGVNQYVVSNFSRLLITSNYKHCMRLDKDDRRYFCLEISDAELNNDEYFDPMVSDLTNDEAQQDFFDYLANYDISDFKNQRPPMSAMKRELIKSNVNNVITFVKDVCENVISEIPFEECDAEIFVSLRTFYNEYDIWCKQNDAKGRKSSREGLHGPMKQCFDVVKTRPRPARLEGYLLNREHLLPYFQSAYQKPDFEFIVAE